MQPQTVVTRNNFIRCLEVTVPNFKVNPLWAEDNLLYVINDLRRYICREADLGLHVSANCEEVEKTLGFLERCLAAAEPEMRDLVHECLDGIASCDQIAEVKKYFGPLVRDLWRLIEF